MNPFELLKQDHLKVKKLCVQMGDTRTLEREKRETLFLQVHQELEIHTQIEEAALYPLGQKFAETQALVKDAIDEHHQIKRLLQELARLEVDAENFLPTFKTMQEITEHHIEEEETELFPKLSSLCSEDQLNQLGEALNAKKNQALQMMQR